MQCFNNVLVACKMTDSPVIHGNVLAFKLTDMFFYSKVIDAHDACCTNSVVDSGFFYTLENSHQSLVVRYKVRITRRLTKRLRKY